MTPLLGKIYEISYSHPYLPNDGYGGTATCSRVAADEDDNNNPLHEFITPITNERWLFSDEDIIREIPLETFAAQ